MSAKPLMERVTILEIKVTKNKLNIQNLSDNTDVATELLKNILEKIMELVDVLNERKVDDIDRSMESCEKEITTTSQEEGGEK